MPIGFFYDWSFDCKPNAEMAAADCKQPVTNFDAVTFQGLCWDFDLTALLPDPAKEPAAIFNYLTFWKFKIDQVGVLIQ